MGGCIAVLNAGSSSIKFALYEVGSCETALYRGQIEQIGVSPRLHVMKAGGEPVAEQRWPADGLDHSSATKVIFDTVRGLLGAERVVAVGHRVVHGGTDYSVPIRVNAGVLASLARLEPLAPLHQPHNLVPIRAIADAVPDMPQVACFDTAFHRDQPALAQLFALPRKFTEAGVRRYGFHGLSYEYVSARFARFAPELAQQRVVIAHLGNGASLCALHAGRSVATTMGFTAVDGLVMGTRCGNIDPGVLIYLMDTWQMDARAIEKLIYRESGLLGVSGISSDMRKLRASSEPAARDAIALFVYRIIREVGSLSAALSGLDAVVFTGGIGENDAAIRAEIAAGCDWLGLRLDETRNKEGIGRISGDTSRVSAFVVPTDEEAMIASHTAAVLRLGLALEQGR